MLDWIRRRLTRAQRERGGSPDPVVALGRAMSGPYQLLHTYLRDRFADTVVLTFGEVEDILGFSLPGVARQDPEWWTDSARTDTVPPQSDAWRLARRTAVPNFGAGIISFSRV